MEKKVQFVLLRIAFVFNNACFSSGHTILSINQSTSTEANSLVYYRFLNYLKEAYVFLKEEYKWDMTLE